MWEAHLHHLPLAVVDWVVVFVRDLAMNYNHYQEEHLDHQFAGAVVLVVDLLEVVVDLVQDNLGVLVPPADTAGRAIVRY